MLGAQALNWRTNWAWREVPPPGGARKAIIDAGFVEPARGFEPRTCALRVRCSTTELRRPASGDVAPPAHSHSSKAWGEEESWLGARTCAQVMRWSGGTSRRP